MSPTPKHPARSRGRRLAVVATLLVLGLASSARAHSSALDVRVCNPPKYPGFGYFTSLTVSGTTCAVGDQVAIAYYHCRTKTKLSGRCTTPVLGFRCSEIRNSIPTEIDARVTCRRGSETVVHTYQQDL